MAAKEKIESLSTQYYEVKYSVEHKESKLLLAEALVIRKDTGEVTRYSCVKYGSDINDIEKLVFDAISKKSDLLSIKPIDWNSDTRNILARLDRLFEYRTGFIRGLRDSVEKGELDNFLDENYGEFLEHYLTETKVLILSIEALSQDERERLLFSDDEMYKNPDDPWNLDDLTLRNHIFNFFIRPSTKEIKLHNIHNDKIGKLYDQ